MTSPTVAGASSASTPGPGSPNLAMQRAKTPYVQLSVPGVPGLAPEAQKQEARISLVTSHNGCIPQFFSLCLPNPCSEAQHPGEAGAVEGRSCTAHALPPLTVPVNEDAMRFLVTLAVSSAARRGGAEPARGLPMYEPWHVRLVRPAGHAAPRNSRSFQEYEPHPPRARHRASLRQTLSAPWDKTGKRN